MIKSFVAAVLLSFCAGTASAQTPPAQDIPPGAPAAKKPGQKAKPVVKPMSENSACDLGVVAAAGNPSGLKKAGITVFGKKYSEVASDPWGIDDLI